MAGFERPNVYRFQVGSDRRARKFLCMEFLWLTGAPATCVWIESEVPREYDRNMEDWVGGYTDVTKRIWVHGNQVLKKKRVTSLDMAVYFMCEALAKNSVVGEEAGNLAYFVFVEWFVKAPKTVNKALREAAPEWWELVTRKDKQ